MTSQTTTPAAGVSPGFYVVVAVIAAAALIVIVLVVLWCCFWRSPVASAVDSPASMPLVMTIVQADGNQYTVPAVRVHDTTTKKTH